MKKKILMFFTLAFLVAVFAMTAFAEVTVTYNIEQGRNTNDTADVNYIVTRVTDTVGGFYGISAEISFDNTVIVPVSAKTASVPDYVTNPTIRTPYLAPFTVYDEINEEDVTSTIMAAEWAVSGTTVTTSADISFIPDTAPETNNAVVLKMAFVYAEGKSVVDITEDTIKIEKITYTGGPGVGTFYYGRDDEGKATSITLVENTVAQMATIDVSSGDVVYAYTQNGAYTKTEVLADGVFTVDTANTLIVVNTGYTSQKYYKVSDSGTVATQISALDNAVLASEKIDIRADENAGLRFYSTFTNALRGYAGFVEYGYLVKLDSTTQELDMALTLDPTKALSAVSYDKNTVDIVYDEDETKKTVTCVMTDIPQTKDAVNSQLASRPYAKITLDGNTYYVYGEVVESSLADACQNILDNSADYSQDVVDYAKSIVDLATGALTTTTADVTIDISSICQ